MILAVVRYSFRERLQRKCAQGGYLRGRVLQRKARRRIQNYQCNEGLKCRHAQAINMSI